VVKEITWLKPPRGQLKLNIDASYVINGTGWGGMACPLDNLLSATTVEAYTLLKGLEFLGRIGSSSCYVESASLKLIRACNREVEINGPYSAILAKCYQMASEMMDIQFLNRKREAN
jgi:hypothetical protein